MKKAEYFVQRGDVVRGPTTSARIRELAAAGKVAQDDLIRRGEDGDWFRAGDMPGLLDHSGAVADDEELIQDPFVKLAGSAVGMFKKAAGTVGKTTLQIGGAVKGAVTRHPEPEAAPALQIGGQIDGTIARRADDDAGPPAILKPVTPVIRIPSQQPPLVEVHPAQQTVCCPFCAETIKRDAKKCKHCGEILDVVLRDINQSSARSTAAPVINISNVNTASAVVGGGRVKAWSPFVAACLSFLLPGLGQLYKGQLLNGIAWFLAVAVGYALFIFPGIFLHFCCVLGAAMGDPYR